MKDAVADSGAQITIFPASLIQSSGIQLTGLRRSKVDLRAANNAKIDVQGVVDAAISALSPTGKRFKTTGKVYIVRNVDKVYLSLDVLVGLRIVNEFFPVAGAGNQHRAKAGVWDRTGTVTEQLSHESYSIEVDGSGRVSKRTRQHLRRINPHNGHNTPTLNRQGTADTLPRQRDCPYMPSPTRQSPLATPGQTPLPSPRAHDFGTRPIQRDTVSRKTPHMKRPLRKPDDPRRR